MDSPTIILIAVLLLFVLLERFRPPSDPIAALLQPPPVRPVDHTEAMIELVRDTLATLERIAAPPAHDPLLDLAVEQRRQTPAFDLDALDPTDTTPWLLADGIPYESQVNVAPEPATHPMGIPGLVPPAGMQWNYTNADAKDEHPFDRFRVDV